MGQSGKNIVVAYKEQASGLGNPEASGAGATGIALTPSPGLQLQSNEIVSNQVRADGQTKLGRLGSYSASGQFGGELAVGAQDDLLEAAVRGTWTAAIALDESVGSLGDLTVGTNTLTAAGGSWIAQGVRAGQMIQLTNHSESANNGKWVRVLSVTTSVITVPAGTYTAATADTAWDITVAKHVFPDNPPTERYFTVEEYYQDIDESLVGEDCKVGGFEIGVSPDNHVTISFSFVGTDLVRKESGAAPHFTSPTYATTAPLVLLDGIIRINGADVVDLTDLNVSFQANAQPLAVIGQRKSPDVFMSNAVGSGSVSGVLNDLAEFAALKAEDNIEVFILASENEADPADFVAFYMGNAAYRTHGAPKGNDGAMIETLSFSFGIDERGAAAGYVPGMILISTSAA